MTETTLRVSMGCALLSACALLPGCQKSGMGESTETTVVEESVPAMQEVDAMEVAESEAADFEEAEADLEPAEGEEITGEVEFETAVGGVRVSARVEGAEPGKHGFHIHEKGDCSDIAGKSMGGHFAPQGYSHALPDEEIERHLGDLGNIQVGENGEGTLEILIPKATLIEGGSLSLLGKAVVVHTGEDSGEAEQPSGDSGTPIACGVIEQD